jgi:hypothetical protein
MKTKKDRHSIFGVSTSLLGGIIFKTFLWKELRQDFARIVSLSPQRIVDYLDGSNAQVCAMEPFYESANY